MKKYTALLLFGLLTGLSQSFINAMDAEPTGAPNDEQTLVERLTSFKNATFTTAKNNPILTAGILCLGAGVTAYNSSDDVKTKLDNLYNKFMGKITKNNLKKQESIARGAKCLLTGLALHSSINYVNTRNFDVKAPKATYTTFFAHSALTALSGASMAVVGVGVKSLYDGLVGYYI